MRPRHGEEWGPKRDDVFVREVHDEKTHGGIVLTDVNGKARAIHKNIHGKGQIVAVGANVRRWPDAYLGLKPGDFVIYPEEATIPDAVEGVRIARADGIVAIIDEDTIVESYRGAGR